MEVPGGLMVIVPSSGDYQFIPYGSIDKVRWKVKHCHAECPPVGYFIVATTVEGEQHMLAGYVQQERAPKLTSGDFLFMTDDPRRDAKERILRLMGSVRSLGGALVAR